LAGLKKHFQTPRDAVAYIMDTFPIVHRKDEEKHGEYRTKRVILEIYDTMQEAIRTGEPYQTRLNPSPGPPVNEEGIFIFMYQLDRDNWPVHIHQPHPVWDTGFLDAWFRLSGKQWKNLDNEQIFPWDGRETFVFAFIPYLIQEKPGEKFEYYHDAALLLTRSSPCKALLLDDALRAEYSQILSSIDWLLFPDEHCIRPDAIRKTLQEQNIVLTEPKNSTAILVDMSRLPPLPPELKTLVPLILRAADNLVRLQNIALNTAELSKLNLTSDMITKELDVLKIA